jgi:hypothetical protein
VHARKSFSMTTGSLKSTIFIQRQVICGEGGETFGTGASCMHIGILLYITSFLQQERLWRSIGQQLIRHRRKVGILRYLRGDWPCIDTRLEVTTLGRQIGKEKSLYLRRNQRIYTKFKLIRVELLFCTALQFALFQAHCIFISCYTD